MEIKKILIAFSGGPDSVFLYHYLKKQGHEIGICYCNHHVREDVDEDIYFVKEFGKTEKIFYAIEDIHLEKFSEEKAREIRYDILEKVRRENGFDFIATGHNKNDNVETILFRMIRGTSLKGLEGIPRTRGNIIRPILDYKKQDIVKYLEDRNIKYMIDYTNNENKYSRNKIRNKIFPIMEEINDSYLDNISRLIELVNDTKYDEKEKISNILKEKGISVSANKIEEVLSIKDKNGLMIDLNDEYVWYSSYDYFGIMNKKELEFEDYFYTININEQKRIGPYEISIVENNKLNNYLEKKAYKIYNVGRVNKIDIRNRKNGDTLDGKKIKSILINKKIDRIVRDRLPLVLIENEIVALADIKYSKRLNKLIDENSNYLIIKKDGING